MPAAHYLTLDEVSKDEFGHCIPGWAGYRSTG